MFITLADIRKLVGEQIRALRKNKGLTQEELASRSNLQIPYVSDIERGERNISLETLDKIIEALEIAPIEVFRFDDKYPEDGMIEKRMLIEGIRSRLYDRDIDDIRFILKVIEAYIDTTDHKDSR